MGRDFPPVFSWDWDGTRFFSVGVGRERFENPLPCHPLICSHTFRNVIAFYFKHGSVPFAK